MTVFNRMEPTPVPENWREQQEQFNNDFNSQIDTALKGAEDPLALDNKIRKMSSCS